MRIAIIGGRGFIGKYLYEELSATGHEVIVTTRVEHLTFPYVYWDGSDRQALQAILEKCDAVVNLAGENIGAKPWTKERKELLRRSRVDTANTLIESLNGMKQKPSVLVQASAVGYYGIRDQPMDEGSPAGLDWLARLCVDWEEPLNRLSGKDIRVIVTRSGVVLGKSDSVLQRLLLPIKLFIGGPLGSGTQWISWIHIKDEVRAIRYLLENKNCRRVYNLTSPEPVQNKTIEKKLAEMIHRPDWIRTPAFLLRMMLGEMSTIILDGQKVYPKRLQEAGFTFEFDELKKALDNLL